MSFYDPSGNFYSDDGRNLGQPQWTPNNGGFWFTLDDKAPGGMQMNLPPPPANPQTDERGPGGSLTTMDPLNPGQYWYRDSQSMSGGLERIDRQGNVVGSYANTAPLSQGGAGWNLNAPGGPQAVQYPTEQGGLFGLGDVWGSIAAVGLLAGIGASAGTLAGPVAAGTASAATTVGAAATLGSAGLSIASQAAQNQDLAKAAGALGLAGGAAGAVSGIASGAGSVGDYLSAAKTGLNVAGQATDDPTLRQAAQYTGYAGSLGNAWGNITGGTGTETLTGNTTGDQLQGGGAMGDQWWSDPNFGSYTPAQVPEWQQNLINAGLQGGGGQLDANGNITTAPQTMADWQNWQADIPESSGGGWLSNLGTGPGGYGPLIGSGISALGSLIGGGIGANAAGNAAQIQANAAREANNALLQQYYQSRADLTPFREAGYQALGGLTGLTQQPFQVGQYAAQPALNPAGYAFTPPSGQQVLNDDPGYQFRLQQGQQALERSASARGTQLSGGQMKAVQGYGQDYASQEYQNAYNRLLGQNQLAYGRGYQQNQDQYARALQEFQTNYNAQLGSRQQRYNELAGVAGTGQTAGTSIANLGGNVAQGMAGNITSAGAAQAAGQVGGANAWNTALSGVGNAANSYLQNVTLNNLANQQGGGGGGNNALLTYLLASRR